MHYGEDFGHARWGFGSYVCHLTISAEVFELLPGGPSARAFAPPVTAAQAAAKAVQAPAAAMAGDTASALMASAHEASPSQTDKYDPANPATHFIRPNIEVAMSPGLVRILGSTLLIASTAEPDGPPGFEAAVKADLQAIYSTPTGKLLLESLHTSGKKIYINYGKANGVSFPNGNWPPGVYQEDGITPGSGIALSMEYNPFQEKVGRNAWNKRPPGIGLVHELIHAEQAAHGRMRRGRTDNPGGVDNNDPDKPTVVHIFELETIGIPPHDQYPFSENKIRAEWNPPQTTRAHY